MSDRKAELERKKAKLQALREEKDRRRREKEQKDVEEATVNQLALHILEIKFSLNNHIVVASSRRRGRRK